jgi:hypothetical protein
MMRIRKIQRGMLVGAFLTLGMAVTVYADVMQGTGHLEKQSTACAGPFFIDGANGGFIVRGTTTASAGHWTVLQSGDCRFENTETIVDVTTNELSQFIGVADHAKFFPGCFKLCVTTSNSGTSGKIDYSMLMDSGPF